MKHRKYNFSKQYLYSEYIIQRKYITQIAKENNVWRGTISSFLDEYQIPKWKTKLTKNDDFFKNGNNCYWAGFFAADGCVTNNRIRIKLNIKDIELLEQLKKDINYTGDIYMLNNNMCYLQICSSLILIKDLKKYFSITPRKSLTLQPPIITNLQDQLAFIVGVIDGDGCVSTFIDKHKNYNISLSITGTKELLTWIADILYQLEDQNKYNKLKISEGVKNSNKNTYRINYHRKRGFAILNILDNIQVPYKLSRKWDKVKKYGYDKGYIV